MIAINAQEQVEIYSNDDGQLVIRQVDSFTAESNTIYIWPEYLDRFVEALQIEAQALDSGEPITCEVPDANS